MSTLANPNHLLRQVIADQREVMGELTRIGPASRRQLEHVLPDLPRLKGALKGLRRRGYIEFDFCPVWNKGIYHVAADYPEDDLELLMIGR